MLEACAALPSNWRMLASSPRVRDRHMGHHGSCYCVTQSHKASIELDLTTPRALYHTQTVCAQWLWASAAHGMGMATLHGACVVTFATVALKAQNPEQNRTEQNEHGR